MWIANFLIGLCAFFIALNWIGLLGALSSKANFSFAPPFLAGIAGCLVALAHPSATVNELAWVFIVVDPSIGFALGVTTVVYLKKKFSKG